MTCWARIIPLLLLSIAPSLWAAEPAKVTLGDGYRGVWYMNQPQNDAYKYKYSGGLGTYPQQHVPLAVYSPQANKTFFCYGGKRGQENRLSDMVGFFDHATGRVSRPVCVLSRQTNDLHYNPSLCIDEKGHVYVFCNSHGTGYELSKDDPTHGKAFIFRSVRPHSIDGFEVVYEGNFSYSQPWLIEGKGILWLHTRYENGRRFLNWAASEDGKNWSEPRRLARMDMGSYQISWSDGRRVITALDYHPKGVGLNGRTNLYYLESADFGQTWTTAGGQKIELPLVDPANAALVRDFKKEELLVYLKDIAFDRDGRPVVMYLNSRSYKSGPGGGPWVWHTARWNGGEWVYRRAVESDHNYDHGSLYIEPDGAWRLIAPTEPGPQAFATGGQIAVHVSRDQGQTWQKTGVFAVENGRNQTYVRRPYRAHEGFYGFWADGDAFGPSESDLFYCTKEGKVVRLPREME